MTTFALSDRVHWIGAFDGRMRTFDVILNTPNGTTYNAYCVRGSEGVAVIDTVKRECADQFFARLQQYAAYDEIRAVVLNHLEPDHSGCLPELLRRAPNARLYISDAATGVLKGLVKDAALPYTTVTTGSRVGLGDRSLVFLQTPYLHWPDTQCTWVPEERILFSGDAFGCHFCDERLWNDEVGDFRYAFEYYYAHIMRPFKRHVLDALALIEPLDLAVLAPAHGPILRQDPRDYVARYRELSTPRLHRGAREGERTIVVFYISSYGNTQRMAEAIRDGVAEIPGLRLSVYDLEGTPVLPFVDLVEAADAVLIGSPTINGDAVKPVWDLLSSFAQIDVRGKLGGAFGSFGWSGEAVRMIEDRLRGLKFRVPLGGLKVKLVPSHDEIDACRNWGRGIGEFLTGCAPPREIDFAALVGSS